MSTSYVLKINLAVPSSFFDTKIRFSNTLKALINQLTPCLSDTKQKYVQIVFKKTTCMILDFQYPIVETELSLMRKYDSLFRENKSELVFDLVFPIPIFKHYLNPKTSISSSSAKYFAETTLTNITNAYKQFDKSILDRILIEVSKDIINVCKGSVLNEKYCEYLIDKALINNDTVEVKTNSKIRFLQNPYYRHEIGANLNNLKRKQENILLGQKRKEKNHLLIHNAIIDHDCNLGRLKYGHLEDSTGLSVTSIKNYLKNYPLLKNLYDEVKYHSMTNQQKIMKKYNNTKISKRASYREQN